MTAQFIPQFNPQTLEKRRALLLSLQGAGAALFVNMWNEDSVWEWTDYLLADWDTRLRVELGSGEEKEKAFFLTAAAFLDFDLLENILRKLQRLLEIKPRPGQSDGSRKPLAAALQEEWGILAQALDLTAAGAELLWRRVNGLSSGELEGLMVEMRPLAREYNDFRAVFLLVASALVYYIPPAPLVDVEHLRYALATGGEADVKTLARVANFLGWAFWKKDAAAALWAVDFLRRFVVLDQQLLGGKLDMFILAIFLHLSFGGWARLDSEARLELFRRYLWRALCLGVPLDEILRESAGGGAVLGAVSLANSLENSEESMHVDPRQTPWTVGKFLQRFSSAANGDFGGYVQTRFVDNFAREQKWPGDLRGHLFIFLHIYVSLKTGKPFARGK